MSASVFGMSKLNILQYIKFKAKSKASYVLYQEKVCSYQNFEFAANIINHMTEHCRLRLHLDIKYVGEMILKFSSKMNGGDMFNCR